MKKRLLVLVVLLAVGYVVYDQFKGDLFRWYAHNYLERETPHPSSAAPDQVILTWNDDPRTSVAVSWRTSTEVTSGVVEYGPAGSTDQRKAPGSYAVLEDALLVNDPVAHRFTTSLTGLAPDTVYRYRVGTEPDSAGVWTDWTEFTTAPAAAASFSFVYLGDAQQGLDAWGALVQACYERHPDAAFYAIAGDLVNTGSWRDEWDAFFKGGEGVFNRAPVVPALGNHDVDRAMDAELYLASFPLPANGPEGFPPGRAYSFTYGNCLFVVLDSNYGFEAQTPWLEAKLADPGPMWKFVMYHHPAHSSRRARDNREVRERWAPLFEQYGVTMALQGHDHSYHRTYPMRNGEYVSNPAEGTYYVISVSGTKFYPLDVPDHAEVAFADIMTYQVINIETEPDRLTYRAYDIEGAVLDEVIIEK